MSAPEYRIESVRDFLSIPADRRAVALHEFAAWLELTERAEQAFGRLRELGIAIKTPDAFIWVDDGLAEVRVGATTEDGAVVLPPTAVAKIKPAAG